MALGTFAEQALAAAIADRGAAAEVVAVVNTDGGGTLSGRARRILRNAFGSSADGNAFISAVENGTGLSATNVDNLGRMVGFRQVAVLFRDEMLGKTLSVNDTVTIAENVSAVRT